MVWVPLSPSRMHAESVPSPLFAWSLFSCSRLGRADFTYTAMLSEGLQIQWHFLFCDFIVFCGDNLWTNASKVGVHFFFKGLDCLCFSSNRFYVQCIDVNNRIMTTFIVLTSLNFEVGHCIVIVWLAASRYHDRVELMCTKFSSWLAGRTRKTDRRSPTFSKVRKPIAKESIFSCAKELRAARRSFAQQCTGGT